MRSRYSWWPRWSPGSRSIIRHCNASLVISRNAESPGGPCNISATIRIISFHMARAMTQSDSNPAVEHESLVGAKALARDFASSAGAAGGSARDLSLYGALLGFGDYHFHAMCCIGIDSFQ